MRTFNNSFQSSQDYYEHLALYYKRALPPTSTDDAEKEEMESMEDTDTEKKFKRVNVGSPKPSKKILNKSLKGLDEELEDRPTMAQSAERYRKIYELEKLRYAEEQCKYFY